MSTSTLRRRRRLSPKDHDQDMPQRIPAPSYRHAAPSGPWPWMDIDSEPEPDAIPPESPNGPLVPPPCPHTGEECNNCWTRYPQSLFPNWRPAQVARCHMLDKVAGSHKCVIRRVDVNSAGQFSNNGSHCVSESVDSKDKFWEAMKDEQRQDNRVRALLVENLNAPALRILGTIYHVEPFFFSSSLNWIPSRYQEAPTPGEGDHITITLTFLRAMKDPVTTPVHTATSNTSTLRASTSTLDQVIDTQLPLPLRSSSPQQKEIDILLLDLLAIHMVRTPENSTIISYHPSHDRRIPPKPHVSARQLHSRVNLAGQSVYWQKIFRKSEDPTFVLLTILWYALYAWDEALETLWEHICYLELSVLNTNDMLFTQELHKIRAHLLHYSSLLDDFRKSVIFVLETPNPAMENARFDEKAREKSQKLLKKECENLLMEIDRLSMSRKMQDKRLKNVLNLVFHSVNIQDSKRMQSLTQAAVRDSAAMKQIAYLTMAFLPASFCAAVFGMNIKEINPTSYGTLAHYFATAVPLTVATIWIIMAFHDKFYAQESPDSVTLWKRLSWPMLTLQSSIERRFGRKRNTAGGEGVENTQDTTPLQNLVVDGKDDRSNDTV